MVLSAGAVTTQGITFAGNDGTLDIVDSSSLPTTTISGFALGDSIGLDFLAYSSSESLSVSGDTVTVSAGDTSFALTIAGASDTGMVLERESDGTAAIVVCYYPGTRIRTPSGDVAVQDLALADLVMTAAGLAMPIRWIGRNTVSTRFADPLRVLPIRICAGALAEGLPERDLLVSPAHAVLVDGILVQAGALVNGTSIIRETNVPETFTYFHVELSEHALILAEGVLAETFVDNIARTAFDNWAEHEALYGEEPITEMPFPRAQSRRQVSAQTMERLRARAVALMDRPQSAA
ncbi:Hint domain-containing protein [Acidisoma cellulosilytica]|uniref:Hint domain-containing protein n=2 Tax=Acidisoma cellulosilyticum TaxID=2802395 RepID=A0A963Z2N2_9PROT|nr:Hint domain-containing protein [Acidisoma cellulosilyticum]